MLTNSSLLEEEEEEEKAENLGYPKKITREENRAREIGKEREKKDKGESSGDSACKNPLLKVALRVKSSGEAPDVERARGGISRRREMRKRPRPSICQMEEARRRGLRDSYHRFAISVSLMKASR